MFKYNHDYKTRDNYVKAHAVMEGKNYSGGCWWFNHLSQSDLQWLLIHHFANLKECQNNTPDLQTLYDFAEDNNPHLDVNFDGYLVSSDRDDYRVSIDTVNFTPPTETSTDEIRSILNLIDHHEPDSLDLANGQIFWD